MSKRSDEPLPDPERRGYLLNEYTGSSEYFFLRGGVLRIRQSPRGPDTGSVFLAHGSTVTLGSHGSLANNVLEIRSRVPYVQEYILAATSESEAEGWHDDLQASIQAEQSKVEKLITLLENGCTMHKYNYSNSKRSRRYFWVAGAGRDLCWGRAKNEDTQKVDLRECIGIIYGPMTTTFQRAHRLEDASWSCFSLLFMGRTLDLAVAGDLQVHAWFLGMQHLISQHGIGSMPLMSNAQFIAKKVQLKLSDAAHAKKLVLGRFLLESMRSLASDKGYVGLGRGAVVSGGRLKGGISTFSPPARGEDDSKSREKMRSPAPSPQATARINTLQSRVLQLQTSLRERSLLADAADAALKNVGALPQEQRQKAAVEALREFGLKKLRDHVSGLEKEVKELSDLSEQLAPQVKTAEKTEKQLRKMQAKVDEYEEKKSKLQSDVDSGRASSAASSGARASISAADAASKSKAADLQRTIADLEQKLKNIVGNKCAEDEALNKKQAEAIGVSEQERLSLVQKAEALERDLTSKKDSEAKSRAKLQSMQDLQHKLHAKVAPLKASCAKLRDEQRRTVADMRDKVGKEFNDALKKLTDGIAAMDERKKGLDETYSLAMEDRKRLHNLVLDLKGNIRVFVRVRPMNEKEKSIESSAEPTINYKDDNMIGVWDNSHSRRKTFEFDMCFSPSSTQVQVFEEAKPLATSVLDGYKVCIFAYGQTGSGKTYTMSGTPKDPGLNNRVLEELFRIQAERKMTHDITFLMAVTEVYNEQIRDLLAPEKDKKLDVKLNSDGTCAIPGLHEEKVITVQDVFRCIDQATKNRAVTCTDMNEQSSRSHSLVTVKTSCAMRGAENTYVGKIHLIDLAGSENVGKSGVTGQGMKEAQNINKSLSALGDVIASLVAKNPHTPYRNSKLTMMLKDSLGGDSKTLMIVQASPAQTNVVETLSSLNFASRARNVELGKAKRQTA